MAVMIGTTHFINAVVQRRDLVRVPAIHIGLPASASLEPMVDWPRDLRVVVDPLIFMVEGAMRLMDAPLCRWIKKRCVRRHRKSAIRVSKRSAFRRCFCH